MPKQAVSLNFSQGLDTKSDPFQVSTGKFSSLTNSVFTKGGMLQKRNGFGSLPSLPDDSSVFCTTFNGDLTAIGTSLQALSTSTDTWFNKGAIQPLDLNVMPAIRNNLNQSQVDAITAPNGLTCVVYTELQASGSANLCRYAIIDSDTGQNVVAPTTISGADPEYGFPRVFLTDSYFIIVYTNKVVSTYHVQFIAISISSPTRVSSPTDVSTSYTPALSGAFDGVVLNGTLYLAWNGASTSGLKMAYVSPNLTVFTTSNPDSAHQSTIVSVCADTTAGIIYASYWDSGTTNGYTLAVDAQMHVVLAATKIINTLTITNLVTIAKSGVMTAFYELSGDYSYVAVPSHSTRKVTCTFAGVVGTPGVVARSVGLASKPCMIGTTIYLLTAYQSPYQNSYFLMDSSGNILSRLAYQNGGGYLTHGTPTAQVNGTNIQIPYLIKDLIQAVNKNTNTPNGSQTAGIYSQTGINISNFTLGNDTLACAEIGANLNITGGFVWAYDGYTPVEQNFFLYPDSVVATTATGGGGITEQQYYYQVTYEWTDNQGNAFRSAPSIPFTITTSTATSTNTINVPTLRLTYKTANPVKIVVYRWSTAQQLYYQVTSITAPTLNNTAVNSVAIVDALSDAAILGNNLLYTTGGVVENIGPPAFRSVFTFDDRLWGIVSEDPNLVWFSKQVIENTPVEMSDLFTIFVAPGIGAQGPTGALTCGAPMDDKAILFKSRALYYVNGSGPDNTGASNQYSQPIFITSMVGCSNQQSIVFQPQGLMFEFASESGNQIWIVGRDLSTQYIGAPVESLTKNATVTSAIAVPGTNQVRFNLNNGTTLMYDYFYGQWGTFSTNAISSTLYQGLHTYINPYGSSFQETPGVYLDGTSPVLLSFTTGWLNLSGLRGYERIHEYSFLGVYYSPHKLRIQTAYDYEPAEHNTTFSPSNFSPVYGDEPIYGNGSPYGGNNIEQFRVFAKKQKCKAFQISLQESYDPSFGVPAGAGLSLSGINLVITAKKGWAPVPGAKSVG